MKETGIAPAFGAHWNSPNFGATNSSGWTALPGGTRSGSGSSGGLIGNFGYWWSYTEGDPGLAWRRYLHNAGEILGRFNFSKIYGFSVRCLRD